MSKQLVRIEDVKMYCGACNKVHSVGKCLCDGDVPNVDDDGRLRCPDCLGVVSAMDMSPPDQS